MVRQQRRWLASTRGVEVAVRWVAVVHTPVRGQMIRMTLRGFPPVLIRKKKKRGGFVARCAVAVGDEKGGRGCYASPGVMCLVSYVPPLCDLGRWVLVRARRRRSSVFQGAGNFDSSVLLEDDPGPVELTYTQYLDVLGRVAVSATNPHARSLHHHHHHHHPRGMLHARNTRQWLVDPPPPPPPPTAR